MSATGQVLPDGARPPQDSCALGSRRDGARLSRKPEDVLGLAGANFLDEIDKICCLIRCPENLVELEG